MKIEIWSDIACPWCYVGKHRFDAALAQFPASSGVLEVIYRSFQLDPSMPPVPGGTLSERLAQKYRIPVAQAEAMNAQMTQTGAEEGIEFHFERARPANTFDAHRLVHLASESGRQREMKERLFQAYFSDGLLVSDREVLAALAVGVGLSRERAADMLASEDFADAVRDDQARARQLGISGVPFYVFNEMYGVSGAQPSDVLLDVMRDIVNQPAA